MITSIDVSNWSDVLEKVRHPSSEFAPPSDTRGRVRSAYFSFTNAEATDWNDDSGDGHSYLGLAVIPAYARIQEIELVHNSLSADHADDAIAIGLFGSDNSGFISRALVGSNAVADDPDFFGETAGAGNYDSADLKRFADSIANNYGYRTEKTVLLVARILMNEAPGIDTNDGELRGFVRYVVD